jgi:hypothetical protein
MRRGNLPEVKVEPSVQPVPGCCTLSLSSFAELGVHLGSVAGAGCLLRCFVYMYYVSGIAYILIVTVVLAAFQVDLIVPFYGTVRNREVK